MFDAMRMVSVPAHLNWGDGMRFADQQLRGMLPHAVQRDYVLDNLVKTANGKCVLFGMLTGQTFNTNIYRFGWSLNWRLLERQHVLYRSFQLPENKRFLGATLFVKGMHSNELE